MQKLSGKYGQTPTVKAVRFLSIRLKSRPESAHLAKDLDDERAELRNKFEEYEQAKEERIALTSEIQYLDGVLDRKVMELSRTVLLETENDRNAPKYRKLFSSSPSERLKDIASDAQERFVKGILSRLREDEDYKHLQSIGDDLEDRLIQLKNAVEQRKELYLEESQKETDWRIAKDEVQRHYNLTYHYLQLIFPGDEALVESFFSKLSKSSSKGNEE